MATREFVNLLTARRFQGRQAGGGRVALMELRKLSEGKFGGFGGGDWLFVVEEVVEEGF